MIRMLARRILPLLLPLFSVFAQVSRIDSAEGRNFDEEWRWVHFTTESGLPSNEIFSLLETRDGNVWVGTSKGVAWFDGYRWIPLDSSKGLPQTAPDRMSAAGDSTLVIHTKGNIYIGSRSGFRRIPIPLEVFEAVAISPDKILIHADSSLYLYENGNLKLFEASGRVPPNLDITREIWLAKGGGLWLNTHDGFYHLEEGVWQRKIKATSRPIDIHTFVESEDGRGLVSIGMPFDLAGLWEWKNNSLPARRRDVKADWIKSVDIGPQGETLILYRSGEILMKKGEVWSPIFPLPIHMRNMRFLQFARDGNLWIGSDRGLSLFNRRSTRWRYIKEEFPSKNRVHEIIRARDGSFWLGSANGVVILQPNGKKKTISTLLGTKLIDITGVTEDKKGNIWISSGSSFNGTFRWDGSSWKYFRVDDRFQWLRFHKIRKDKSGNLWFLGLSRETMGIMSNAPGAFIYDYNQFKLWGKDEGLPSCHVYAFAEGTGGDLWFGTLKSLSRLRAGRWTHWQAQKDLAMYCVFTLAIDYDSNVWFGDRENGLGCIDREDKIKHFKSSDGLVSDKVWDLTVDSLGRLWVATEAGLSMYDKGVWSSYDSRCGLMAPGLWPVLPLGDTVYVGTVGMGLGILNLRECEQPLPLVFLSQAGVEGNTVNLIWSSFAYWGDPSPDAILTRYRLNENDWSAWSTARSISLSGLKPGDYSYRVQAQNVFGNFSPEGMKGSFVISSPPYLRPLFVIPLGTATLAAISLLIAYISRRRSHAKALKISEVRFRQLAESTFEGIFIHQNGRVLDSNQNILRILGCERADFVGNSLFGFVAPEYRDLVQNKIISEYPKPYEVLAVRKDGSTMWVEVNAKTIPYENSTCRIVAIRDITERKEGEEKLIAYQEQLRSMASELSITEERERRQMAAILHDTIGQALAFCKIKLGRLQENASACGLEKQIGEVRHLIEQAIHNTRSLTFDLSPPVLQELGIEAAVESLTEQMEEQHGIRFNFDTDEKEKPLNDDFRILIYRSVRELLTNIVKHSHAKTASVSMRRADDSVIIDIYDDGVGFSSTDAGLRSAKYQGFGLFNIRERLNYLGGRFEIESAAGKGTRITISAPLEGAGGRIP